MASISSFVSEAVSLNIKVKNGQFSVTYRPHELTPAREDVISKLAETDPTSDSMLELYTDLIAYHDLQGPLVSRPYVDARSGKIVGMGETVMGPDGASYTIGDTIVSDGVDIPIQPFYLRHLPSTLIQSVLEQIRGDMQGDPKSSQNRSGIGSSRRQ